MAIPTMSLKVAQYVPTTFEGNAYQYQGEDLSILERSLAQREARMNKAYESYGAVKEALGKIEPLLHKDEETDKWYHDYEKNIYNQIQAEIDNGNYGRAIRYATNLATNAAQDTQILGRIKANAEYNKYVEELKQRQAKGEFGQTTLNWALAQNPYHYEDIKDDNGNIVSGTDWNPSRTVYGDFNFRDNALIAFKMLTPYKNSTGTSTSTGYADGTSHGEGSQDSYEKVRYEDILANMDRLISSEPDAINKIEQRYATDRWELKQMIDKEASLSWDNPEKQVLREQIAKRKQLLFNNANEISYRDYYARMVTDELYAKGLAYDWRTHNDSTSNDYRQRITGHGGGAGAGIVGYDEMGEPIYTDGPLVEQSTDIGLSAIEFSKDEIENMFEKPQNVTNPYNITWGPGQ